MGIEDIIQKFNYNEELANFLRKAYPAFVEQFDEQLVYDALSNVEIVIKDKNVADILKERGFLKNEKDQGLVSFETLKVCSGVYHSETDISYNKALNSYSIDNVRRIVAENASSLILESRKSALVHELGHLIKSYRNEYTIKGDTLVEKSGLITRIYQLHEEDGVVVRELWSESCVGLEEGLNAILEDQVTSKIIGRPYFSNGYQSLKELARLITNLVPGLLDAFKEAQMYHDNTRIDNILGQTYYDLIEFTDKIYPMVVKIADMTVRENERREIANTLKVLLDNEFKPIVQRLKAIGQGSMDM